jgi:hypothetical protein
MAVLDHDVMFVGDTVDANGAKGEGLKAHQALRRHYILALQCPIW